MLDTITPRGFEPRATAIAARTIGGCYEMCFYPDTRPLIGLAIFSMAQTDDGHCFTTEARALRDGELPDVLLDWLEPRIPDDGALIGWDHWLSLPRRLTALAGDRHPRIRAAAGDTAGRWRDLPQSMTWHHRHARASAMPCLCPGNQTEPCRPELPAALLPDPAFTEQSLINEAMLGWATWARLFPELDDVGHPALRALNAARIWAANRTDDAA